MEYMGVNIEEYIDITIFWFKISSKVISDNYKYSWLYNIYTCNVYDKQSSKEWTGKGPVFH